MKNFKLLLLAAVLLCAAYSCEKAEAPMFSSEPEMVSLILSTGEPTKTHISDVVDSEGFTEIHWDQGDQIKVLADESYNGNNAYTFKMYGDYQDSKYAKFKGKVPYGTENIFIVYPANSASCTAQQNESFGSDIRANLPASQSVGTVANSFAQNHNISIAKTTIPRRSVPVIGELIGDKFDYDLDDPVSVKFINVCSLLSFTVSDESINEVTIVADVPIAGDLNIDYTGESPVTTIVANGSKSIKMSGDFKVGQTYWFVLAPVTISQISVYVNTTEKKQCSAIKTFEKPISLTPGHYRSLGYLNIAKMPSFDFDCNINYDGGILNGTDVVFSFPTSDISNLNLTIKDKDNKTVRNINEQTPEIVNNSYVSSYVGQDWPYLPKGDYVLSGSYSTTGGNCVITDIPFTIEEDPEFTVSTYTEAYTSYSRYVPGNPSAANSLSGTDVYFQAVETSVSIAKNILTDSKYYEFYDVKMTSTNGGEAKGQFNASYLATLAANKYGEYTNPSLTFDGVSRSFTNTTCHVTGLPYTLNVTVNDSVNPWSENNNVKWNNTDRGTSVRVGYALGDNINTGSSSLTKTFYLPKNINVTVNASAEARGSSFIFKIETKGSISVSGTEACGKTAKGYNKYESFSCSNKEMELSSSNPKVELKNSNSTNEACTYFKSLTIYYR